MLLISILFLCGESLGGCSPRGGFRISHDQPQFRTVLLAPHQDEKSKVGYVVTQTRSWITSEPLFRGFSQQDLFSPVSRRSFWAHGRANISVISQFAGEWFHIQGSANFIAAHFVAKCHTMDSSQKPISAACTWDIIISVITQDSGS